MVFSNQPFLNIEDSSLNVDTPIFVGYDSSMSVEMFPKEDEMLLLGMLLKMMLKMLMMLMHTYQSCI
jgi:hypothetical protein